MYRRQTEEARRQRDTEQARRHAEAQAKAQAVLDAAQTATLDHAYLIWYGYSA